MSPTVHRERGLRFFFFSREETRIHVHVYSERGEAKFWLEPEIEVAANYGLPAQQLQLAESIIKEHHNDFIRAWRRYFRSGSD